MINASNYDPKTKRGEVFTLPSKTVPDMSLSIRDLMERHKSGGQVKSFVPVYADETVPVGLERMDKIERAAYARELADFVEVTRGKLVSAREARARAAADAAFEAEVKKRMDARLAPIGVEDVIPAASK